jgi:hypothetical protein
MSKKLFLGIGLLFITLFGSRSADAYPTEMLLSSGPSANRVNLVILGDGYRTQDQTKLTTDATNLMNALLTQPLFVAYRNHYNVKLVHVVSNQNGADNGDFGAVRDTALGANYGCFGIDRLLCVNNSTALSVAAQDAPEFDTILVVVNDTKYGGSGTPQIATTSVAPGATDIPVHEIGHSLFGLADEYDTPTPGYPHCDPVLDCPEANATVFSQRSQVKWNYWINASTPVPTPDTFEPDGTVGAFAGARYFFDQYRPVRDCLMRSLGRTLCPVCREAGVLTSYSYVNPVDQATPTGAVSLTPTQSQTFAVQGPRPTPDTMSFTWSIDGSQVAVNQTGSLALLGSAFGNGSHTLGVSVRDLTSFVRRDTTHLLEDSFSWPVSVGTGGGGALFSDNFEDGNANGWTPFTASQWVVITDGTRVYQRNSTAANWNDSRAGSTSWTNQSVEARVKVVQFAGSSTSYMANVYARHNGGTPSAGSAYYGALRSDGRLVLRKRLNGSNSSLVTVSAGITASTWYTLRLEVTSSGSSANLKLFLNGVLRAQHTDSSNVLTAGQIGVGSYGARAEFDDIVVNSL